MKQLVSAVLVVTLLFVASPASFAEPRQVMQGTQVRLTLLNSVGTAASREGDPFVAVVAEPVYLGNQLLIPAAAVKLTMEIRYRATVNSSLTSRPSARDSANCR